MVFRCSRRRAQHVGSLAVLQLAKAERTEAEADDIAMLQVQMVKSARATPDHESYIDHWSRRCRESAEPLAALMTNADQLVNVAPTLCPDKVEEIINDLNYEMDTEHVAPALIPSIKDAVCAAGLENAQDKDDVISAIDAFCVGAAGGAAAQNSLLQTNNQKFAGGCSIL